MSATPGFFSCFKRAISWHLICLFFFIGQIVRFKLRTLLQHNLLLDHCKRKMSSSFKEMTATIGFTDFIAHTRGELDS